MKAPYWSGVFAMSLGVFALIASKFMPVTLTGAFAVGTISLVWHRREG